MNKTGKLKAAKEALEAMLGVSHRLTGCALPITECHPCRENKEAVGKARAALKLLSEENGNKKDEPNDPA